MHKLYYRPIMVPETIKNVFIQHENIHQYNTRHKGDFHAVHINTATYGKRTIAYKGRNLWDQLPKDLKETGDTFSLFGNICRARPNHCGLMS